MPKSKSPFDDLSSALSRGALQGSLRDKAASVLSDPAADKAIAAGRNTAASRALDSVSGIRDAMSDLTGTASAAAQASVMKDMASHTALASSTLQADRSVAKALDAITCGAIPGTAVHALAAGKIGSTAGYKSSLGDTAASILGKVIDPFAGETDSTALSQANHKLPTGARTPARGYASPRRSVLDEIGGRVSPVPSSSATRASVNREAQEPAPRSDATASPTQVSFVPVASVSDIGKRVRERRKAMGMTQQRFADLAGVGRRFLVELEQGKPSLEIGRVLAVCHAAGIKLGFPA